MQHPKRDQGPGASYLKSSRVAGRLQFYEHVCQSQQRHEGMHIEATDLEYWESN